MSEFHCHCECSKCPPPASTQAFSRFHKSLTALSISPSEFTVCLLMTLAGIDATAENTFKNDNLVIIYKQNKLLFIKMSL